MQKLCVFEEPSLWKILVVGTGPSVGMDTVWQVKHFPFFEDCSAYLMSNSAYEHQSFV